MECLASRVTGVPGSLPPHDSPYREKVQRAYTKARAQGLDPSKDLIVTDVGASKTFEKFTVGVLPCITASRGSCRRFHLSTLDANMDIKLMERCQGFPENFFSPASCNVPKTKYGAMIGNSVSTNVFMRFLPRLLFAAQLTARLPKDYWEFAIDSLKSKGLVNFGV